MNAKEKRIIKKVFNQLYRITESSHDFENLVRMTTKEEREHRKCGARFTNGQASYNAPLGLTGEYFAVKEVLDGLTANYTAEHFLYIKQSALIRAGIAHKYADRIKAEIAPEDMAEFATLDYVEFIK